VPSPTNASGPLGAELEAAALRVLRSAYDDLNLGHFKGRLTRPVLELCDAGSRLGRWVRAVRTIELGRSLLTDHGWGVLVEVLKHEMAHQFVDEVLGLEEHSAHGPAFREVCLERGIDPRAAGVPRAPMGGDEEGRIIDRIAKLLALATSPNVHEAQSAALAAQRLMLKHNLDVMRVGRQRSYGFRHLGRPTGRLTESDRILAAILGDHFFVQVIWVPVWRPLEGKRGSVLEVCGTPENLELAEYAHTFLTHTAERLWLGYKRERGQRGDTGRRAYLAGVMAGFREKLRGQQQKNQKLGLVWVGDGELGKYFRQRHPHVRWTRHAGERRSEVFAHGQAAGRRIVLQRAVSQGPSAGKRPLLGPRK
jgi:hypothetical protein